MSLIDLIHSFIENPFPLWENNLTQEIVKSEWESLAEHSITPEQYSTARSYYKDINLSQSDKVKIYGTSAKDPIYVEYPQKEILQNFYEYIGLEVLNQSEIESIDSIQKISNALQILGTTPGILECLSQVVKCIIILRQDDPEIDTSHSDPNIPFSIFVSVCEETSDISILRVAESILHEAMHLKLTMIEHHIDLIIPETKEVFYSPWRDEERPLRGVLHGLFVFKAIYEFYSAIIIATPHSTIVNEFLNNRISDIEDEFKILIDFHSSVGLTPMGASLIENLLPLN